jgi:uncharacterized protein (TIGR03067 family)
VLGFRWGLLIQAPQQTAVACHGGNKQKEKQEGTINLGPPTKVFDWTWTFPKKGATRLALYELKGDDLKIGFGNDGLVRPKRFEMGKENVVWLLVLKRVQP